MVVGGGWRGSHSGHINSLGYQLYTIQENKILPHLLWSLGRHLTHSPPDPARMTQNLCLQCFHLVLANCTKFEFLAVQSQQLVELLHYSFTVLSSNRSLLVSLILFFTSFFCYVSFLRHLWCSLLLGPVLWSGCFLIKCTALLECGTTEICTLRPYKHGSHTHTIESPALPLSHWAMVQSMKISTVKNLCFTFGR